MVLATTLGSQAWLLHWTSKRVSHEPPTTLTHTIRRVLVISQLVTEREPRSNYVTPWHYVCDPPHHNWSGPIPTAVASECFSCLELCVLFPSVLFSSSYPPCSSFDSFSNRWGLFGPLAFLLLLLGLVLLLFLLILLLPSRPPAFSMFLSSSSLLIFRSFVLFVRPSVRLLESSVQYSSPHPSSY